MTLVEFFSNEQIENIISTLIVKPEKVIFIGYEDAMSKEIRKSTVKYLEMKITGIRAEFVTVKNHELKSIINTLDEIYRENPDCVFDLTGGEELILVAMGYVAKEYNVRLTEANISSEIYYKDLLSAELSEKFKVENSIYENIILHGGTIDRRKQKKLEFTFLKDSKETVFSLWDICKNDNSLWNYTVGIFKNLSSNAFPEEKKNSVIEELLSKGLIKVRYIQDEIIYFSYKDEIVKNCLTDPGTVLELYTYFILKENEEFNDVKVGISIDWDGIIHGYYEKTKDTSNEIDVAAMAGVIPVFISCKNGKLTKEALYELETVSKRFGGMYSKKVLVAPILKEETLANEYIKNRAADMGIVVVTDVSKTGLCKCAKIIISDNEKIL